MEYFYLYIFILFCFIIIVSYYNTYNSIESFEPIQKNYVLLGDSIFKNDAYVSNGKSVEHLMTERNKNITCLAQDFSRIVDIYIQIDKIPIELNATNTFIFLSAGGNDILSHYVEYS